MSSKAQVSVDDVKDLFDQAPLDEDVQDIIVTNLNTSAMALAACQGTGALELGATEATIVTFVADGSGSMYEVADAVRESLKESVEAMEESKSAAALTLSLIVFRDNVEVVFANKPVGNVIDTDIRYHADGTTALYDAVMDALTGALAYEESLLQAGLSTKVIVVVFSDGADNASRTATAAKVKAVVGEVYGRENWILAFVGFQTYETDRGIDYKNIAQGMGFPALLEIDLKGDIYERRHTIRNVFRLVSKSVIRKSQTAIDPDAPAADFFAFS